jgi:hypothetical protein
LPVEAAASTISSSDEKALEVYADERRRTTEG